MGGEREREEVKKKGKKKKVPVETHVREKERRERKERIFSISVQALNRAYFGDSRELKFSMITGITSLTRNINSDNWYPRLDIDSGIRGDNGGYPPYPRYQTHP